MTTERINSLLLDRTDRPRLGAMVSEKSGLALDSGSDQELRPHGIHVTVAEPQRRPRPLLQKPRSCACVPPLTSPSGRMLPEYACARPAHCPSGRGKSKNRPRPSHTNEPIADYFLPFCTGTSRSGDDGVACPRMPLPGQFSALGCGPRG